MTLIVTDGRTIAADTRKTTSDGTIGAGAFQKIQERDGRIFAFGGLCALFEPGIDWYLAGMDMDATPWKHIENKDDCFHLWVFEAGKLWQIVHDIPVKEEMAYPAKLGVMRDYAQGVLDMGGSPETAVRGAMKWHYGVGGAVQVVEIPPHLQPNMAWKAYPPLSAN